MALAATQLNSDFSGQSFEPYNTNPPLSLQNMAKAIDANAAGNLTLQASASYANDGAAASGGVPIGGFYRNGSVVQIRVT